MRVVAIITPALTNLQTHCSLCLTKTLVLFCNLSCLSFSLSLCFFTSSDIFICSVVFTSIGKECSLSYLQQSCNYKHTHDACSHTHLECGVNSCVTGHNAFYSGHLLHLNLLHSVAKNNLTYVYLMALCLTSHDCLIQHLRLMYLNPLFLLEVHVTGLIHLELQFFCICLSSHCGLKIQCNSFLQNASACFEKACWFSFLLHNHTHAYLLHWYKSKCH